jgi:hypothetical protein
MPRDSLEDLADATWESLAPVVGAGINQTYSDPVGEELYSIVDVYSVNSTAPGDPVHYYRAFFYTRRKAGTDLSAAPEPRAGNLNAFAARSTVDPTETPVGETITVTVSIHGHQIPARLYWTIVDWDGATSTTTDYTFDFNSANGWSQTIVITGPAVGYQSLTPIAILPII